MSPTYTKNLRELASLPYDLPADVPDATKLRYLEVQERVIPHWDKAKVLKALGVTEKVYNLDTKSGVHGYSNEHEIAVTRATQFPTRVVWHELGHVLTEPWLYWPQYHNDLKQQAGAELEAEAVAYLLCHVFSYNEAKAESRGYLHHWKYTGNLMGFTPESLARIYQATDKIIEATK